MNFKPYYIYKLICPIDGSIKYIGQTQNPHQREREHRCYSENTQNPKFNHYKRVLKKSRLRVEFVSFLCTKYKEEADYWERYFIANTPNLLNLASGGASTITENHFSKKIKGRKLEEIHGVPMAKYIKYLMSQNATGANNPNYKGVNCTPEWREKQMKAQSKTPVLVFDTYTGVYDEFRNSKEAAISIGCRAGNIRMYKDRSWKIKRRYQVFSTQKHEQSNHRNNH